MAQSVHPATATAGARAGDGLGPPPSQLPRRRRAPWLLLVTAVAIPVSVAGLLVVGLFGYLYWQDQTVYVSTDNAHISGNLFQVGSPGAAQIREITVDVGDRIRQGQVIATVTLAMQGGLTPFQVRAPTDGLVVARQGNPGDAVAAGRPIITAVDDSALWVEARIEETKVGRIRPGQPAEVTVDSIGQVLAGRVAAVGATTVSSLSAAQPTNPSAPFIRVTQLVPVRIDLEASDTPLVVGGSVYVRIRTEAAP